MKRKQQNVSRELRRSGTGTVRRLTLVSIAALTTSMLLAWVGYGTRALAATATTTGKWVDITNSGGSFNQPIGVAVDSAGDVFVVNSGNSTTHAVEELPTGSHTWQDISYGSSFHFASGIAVDSAGDVFVTNEGNTTSNAVVELPHGATTWQDITAGNTFIAPSGIIVDGAGDLYVEDYGASKLYERLGGHIHWQDITNGAPFNGPSGIAEDSSGDIFVTNRTATAGKYVLKLPNAQSTWQDISGSGSFSGPFGIGVNSAGDVFVTNMYDTSSNAVEELPPGGSGGSTWEDLTGSGSFNGPTGIAVDSTGDLFVVNVANSTSNAVVEYVVAPGAPTGLSSGSTTATGTTLRWSPVAGAATYNVYQDGTQVATGITSTNYTVDNLLPGTAHSFTVTAVNGGGESAPSQPVMVTAASIGSVNMTFGSSDVLSGTTRTVTGVVYDVYHVPVPNAVVDLSSTIGTWGASSVTADGTGAFSVNWAAPQETSETPGTVTATVYGTVYGAVSNVAPTVIALDVAPLPVVSTTTLPDATVGNSYSAPLSVTGGFTPYTWSVINGALPTGLTLDASTGAVSGKPSAAGASTLTVQVKDADGNTATKSLSITVNAAATPGQSSSNAGSTRHVNRPPMKILNAPFTAPGQPGQPYSLTLNASGGLPPYTWKVVSGSLQPGLTLDEKTGVISGMTQSTTPEILTVQVTDATGVEQTEQVVIDMLPLAARQVAWQVHGLNTLNVPVVVQSDAGKETTYMPIWYVMQLLKPMDITSTWDGKHWGMITSTQSDVSNIQTGSGNTEISLNGTLVQNVNTVAATDPSTNKLTMYMPMWYVMQLLNRVGLHSTWNGTTWTVTK
jgi:hypothetical protein